MVLNEPNENYKTGYIKLFRSLKNHWIWEKGRKRTKLEAFLDLLLMASHSGLKEPIGYDLIDIKKGQILTSQEKLGIQWRWDRGAVRSFLKLLEKDGILNQQTTSKYTMITICKYDSYQNLEPSKFLKPTNWTTSTQHQLNTYNNENKLKNEKEEIVRPIHEIVFEEQNEKFSNMFFEEWCILCKTKKWFKKEKAALEASFKKLKKYEEPFAIELIQNAISGGYQGITFSDTDESYKKWQSLQSATTSLYVPTERDKY